MELRPLGFGEIFDRAITLYVRNFVPFAAIVGVVIVPLAILQYMYDRGSSGEIDQLLRVIQHPNAPQTPILPSFLTTPSTALLFVLLLLAVWVVWPFALNACAVGVARLYRGRPIEFGPCYRVSLERWPSVIGMLALEGVMLAMWYAAFLLAVVLLVMIAVALARISIVAGVVASVFTIAASIAALLVLAPLFVVFTFAMNAIVIERQPVFTALALSFGRVFNRQEIWRSLLFALAALAVVGTASMLVGVLAIGAIYLHWYVLEVVLTSIFRAAVTPFAIVLLAVYYFDVRIRREGYDLEAGLDRLAGATQVA